MSNEVCIFSEILKIKYLERVILTSVVVLVLRMLYTVHKTKFTIPQGNLTINYSITKRIIEPYLTASVRVLKIGKIYPNFIYPTDVKYT